MNMGFVLGCELVDNLGIVCFAILIRLLVKADIGSGLFNISSISIEQSLSNLIQSTLRICYFRFVSSGVESFDLRNIDEWLVLYWSPWIP